MSISAIIARPRPDGFIGRIHLEDGDPAALGRTLYHIHRTQFHGNTTNMLRVLLDEHPAGWVSIVGHDFAYPAGYTTKPHLLNYTEYWKSPEWLRPQCRCHGDAQYPEMTCTEQDELWEFDWIYLIHVQNCELVIIQPHSDNSVEMIGRVRLNGPEPDWRTFAPAGFHTI